VHIIKVENILLDIQKYMSFSDTGVQKSWDKIQGLIEKQQVQLLSSDFSYN